MTAKNKARMAGAAVIFAVSCGLALVLQNNVSLYLGAGAIALLWILY